MDKKKKGLADQGDGDFILNESGTSVNVGNVEGMPKERGDNAKYDDEEPYMPPVAEEQKDNTD
jgi:hypothetical protein